MANTYNNDLLYDYLCIIRDGYRTGNFEPLFPLLDEDVVMHSASTQRKHMTRMPCVR